MDVVILGTIRLIAAFLILAWIARSPEQYLLGETFLASQKWTLNDAYKILIPLLVLTYLQFVLHQTLPQHTLPWVSLISALIYIIAACGCYWTFVLRPYEVNCAILGLDKAKFLSTGVRNANIALLCLLLAVLSNKSASVPSRSIDELMKPMFAAYVLTAVLGVFVTPVLEEVFFRGILYSSVARRIGPWTAIAFLSLTVALLHLHFTGLQSLGHFVISLLLFYSYIKSESLYGPIIWHVVLNFYHIRNSLAQVLSSYIDITRLDRCYIYGLLTCLVITNVFWIVEVLRRRRLQDNRTTSLF